MNPTPGDATITSQDIQSVLQGIVRRSDDALKVLPQADLEQFWHFRYDAGKTTARNTYDFFRMLDLYQAQCRRWEELHHGHVCVVERVRDRYLMPKIHAFLIDLAGADR